MAKFNFYPAASRGCNYCEHVATLKHTNDMLIP